MLLTAGEAVNLLKKARKYTSNMDLLIGFLDNGKICTSHGIKRCWVTDHSTDVNIIIDLYNKLVRNVDERTYADKNILV